MHCGTIYFQPNTNLGFQPKQPRQKLGFLTEQSGIGYTIKTDRSLPRKTYLDCSIVIEPMKSQYIRENMCIAVFNGQS